MATILKIIGAGLKYRKMVTLIKVLAVIGMLVLWAKLYISARIRDKNLHPVRALFRAFRGTFGAGVLFPILRSGKDKWEERMIAIGNGLLVIFWLLFIVTIALILGHLAFTKNVIPKVDQ